MSTINGTEGNDTLSGTGAADTIIGDAGNDTITGSGGNDVLFGDLIDPFEVPVAPPAVGGISDPADEPARLAGSQNVTVAQLLSGSKKGDSLDMSDDNEGGIRDDFLITDSGTSLSGTIDFKFPGTGGGDDTADIARFDLSTFNDNFTIDVKSEDLDIDDNNPFDVDGPIQDVIVLQDVDTLVDNGNGTVTVSYTGSDGNSHTMNIEFNGARIEAYGPGGTSVPFTFDDSISGGAGNDTIDGGLGNDTIDGGLGNDTIIASVGDDLIVGDAGTDTYDATGDVAEGIGAGNAPGPNLEDPADEPARLAGSQDVTVAQLLSSSKKGDSLDMSDDNEGGIRDDFLITDSGTSLSGTIDFKFPGTGSGDDTADIARFDLSTFNDNFTIDVKSEDVGDLDDNNPFDIDAPVQDLIVLQDVDTLVDNGNGSVTATYTGSDGNSYTMNIEFNGARIIGYGTDGGPIDDGDIIEQIDVTVGTTGVDGDNLANYGDGSVDKDDANGGTGTDAITSVENFVANELPGEIDAINLTGPVRATDVNIGNTAVGTFTDENGTESFGGSGEDTLADILARGEGLRDGTFSITGGAESGTVGGISFENFEAIEFTTICFVRGSRIETEDGLKPIEDIEVGDKVVTMDHGLQPVRWIRSTKVSGRGKNAPILFRKGALGTRRDLWVSPQHRMLLSGWQLELMVAEPEALVPAKMLVNDETVLQVDMDEVEYFHMMFDEHEIVYAEGAASESFHPGRMGVGSFSEETREEIFRLFPELETGLEAYGPSARITLRSHEARILVEGSEMLALGHGAPA